MGLDQYAYVSNNGKHDDDSRDIAYWRKHNRLQGWMENKYIDDGGTKEFNCVAVELTIDNRFSFNIPIDSEIEVKSEGLLGSKYISNSLA